ncbi:MAG: hypothetical protein ACP5MH_11535, partial [Thermoproteus sp.]
MSRALAVLVLIAVWALAAYSSWVVAYSGWAATYSGWVVGYATDYVNGTSHTDLFFMFENGTLVPLVGEVPWWVVGSGVKVSAVVDGGAARVVGLPEALQTSPLAQSLVQSPISGPQLVTVVAAKFKDVPNEPYNYSYIHDVVFGPFPSARDFWEYVSGGAITLRPYYISPGWITLPKTTSDYCSSGNALFNIALDVINALYSSGVALPDRSYLVIILNKNLTCLPEVAGEGTIRFWQFNTPYGSRLIAVSLIFHYADWLVSQPDIGVYAHELGHNFGLQHSGTVAQEYDNVWDVMGAYRLWVNMSGWWGRTYYLLPSGLVAPHLYYLGWGSLRNATAGVNWLGPRVGVYWQASDGVYTAEYKCIGRYEQYLDFCGVIFHKLGSP